MRTVEERNVQAGVEERELVRKVRWVKGEGEEEVAVRVRVRR